MGDKVDGKAKKPSNTVSVPFICMNCIEKGTEREKHLLDVKIFVISLID